MTRTYRLTGLSKPKSATLETEQGDIFWATIAMSEEKIAELWGYCKGGWDEPKYAVLEFSEFEDDGVPMNATLIDINLKP